MNPLEAAPARRRKSEPSTKDQDVEARSDEKLKERKNSELAWKGTNQLMQQHGAETFGELVAILRGIRRSDALGAIDGTALQGAVRNRRDLLLKKPADALFATRQLMRQELQKIWDKQRELNAEFAPELKPSRVQLEVGPALTTSESEQGAKTQIAIEEFDDPDLPSSDGRWRHGGLIFSQRATFWDRGTLGHCELEPTDRRCPRADRHAQLYRVIETANRLRIGEEPDLRFLSPTQRSEVIAFLRRPYEIRKDKTRKPKGSATLADLKAVLKLANDPTIKVNLGDDEDQPATDWFEGAIARDAITVDIWDTINETDREKINRVLLRLEPETSGHMARLQAELCSLGLPSDSVSRVVDEWTKRPKLDSRLRLSRRAILNVLRYMNGELAESFYHTNGFWPSLTNAREAFAVDHAARDQLTGEPASHEQQRRYALGIPPLSKSARQYIRKHSTEWRPALPPAPFLPNPVVRSAIHEVRRHVLEWLQISGHRPDQVSIELSRDARLPAHKANEIRILNKRRNRIRAKIRERVIRPAFGSDYSALTARELRKAEDRVLLCLQQRMACAYSGLSQDTPTGVCCYSGRIITPRLAARGDGLQVDHIIPQSRTGRTNALNGRVLCFEGMNASKSNKTPRQWLGDRFEGLAQRFRWWNGYEPPRPKNKEEEDLLDYFSKKDYAKKWKLLNLTDLPKDTWRASQLTDTSYAARQVRAYLAQALFPGETPEDAGKRFLHPKGSYTAILRRDWQLFQRLLPRDSRGRVLVDAEETHMVGRKDRFDHRHHAIDAVGIALMNYDRLQNLAEHAQRIEEAKAKAEQKGLEKPEVWPERTPLPPPWGSVREFRRAVLAPIFREFDDSANSVAPNTLIVRHRPVGRKIVGRLHRDTHFGPTRDEAGRVWRDGRLASTTVTVRIPIHELKPDHLRLPRNERDKEAAKRVRAELARQGLRGPAAKQKADQIISDPNFERLRAAPAPGKSGLICNEGLRTALRAQFAEFEEFWRAGEASSKYRWPNMEPKRFAKRVAELYAIGALRAPNGFPAYRVKIARTLHNPIALRRWQRSATGGLVPDAHEASVRIYEGQNNHHLEIRADANGEWTGNVVDMFEAARRVRPAKRNSLTAVEPQPVIDRTANEHGQFVMSLADGEMVLLRDPREPESERDDFFVVAKIDADPIRIHLFHHTDARPANGQKGDDGKLVPGSRREVLLSGKTPGLPVDKLRALAPAGHAHPVKVEVGALGRSWRVVDERPDRESIPFEFDSRALAIARRPIPTCEQSATRVR